MIVLAAEVLAGCSGASHAVAPVTDTSNAAGATKSAVSIKVKITDPASLATTAVRKPQFVSPSINGILAQVYVSPESSNPTVVGTSATDVSSGSVACGGQTGTRTCTITVPAPAGTDDLVFTAYNMVPVTTSSTPFAGAATLSIGGVYGAPIVANASNTLTVSLSGVISSLSMSTMSVSPSSASIADYPLSITALDAGGNTIVAGSGDPYYNPVTVSVQETGGSGFTFVSLNGGANSPSVSVTQSSQTVSVNYISGSPSGYSATVTESASGITSVAALSLTPAYTQPSASTTITIPAASGSITEYPVGTPYSNPGAITTGPDGNLWFIESSYLDKMTTAGVVTSYAIPGGNSDNLDITSGPDGNIWFTSRGANQIDKVSTSGAFTQYDVPTAVSGAYGITVGSDGNLYFPESYSLTTIGQITTSGAITEFAGSGVGNQPEYITRGSDGNVWFTLSTGSGNAIGRITTGGAITDYVIWSPGIGPIAITNGPDGNLWITSGNANTISKVSTAPALLAQYTVPTTNSFPFRITSGPDGNIWFTEYSANKIGKITVNGAFTEYAIPTPNSDPVGITTGPDGNIWFTESNANKVGKIVP